MNEIEQAISEFKQRLELKDNYGDKVPEYFKALELGIKALEKQVPYKPKVYEDKYYACKCYNILLERRKIYPKVLMPKENGLPYCLACGQKLDWSEEE
jgi:predicted SprT family Zn-dependent metalloprotease